MVSSSVYAAITVSYWYSNVNYVSKWTSTPKISQYKLNNNDGFAFDIAFSHARTQWSNAGISTTLVGWTSGCAIQCFGGTRAEIRARGYSILDSQAGVTLGSSTQINTLSYNGTTKYLKSQNSPQIVCLVDRNVTQTAYKNVMTHEIGHALGWGGHSSNSSDIMYSSENSVTSLTSRDKNHLKQVY